MLVIVAVVLVGVAEILLGGRVAHYQFFGIGGVERVAFAVLVAHNGHCLAGIAHGNLVGDFKFAWLGFGNVRFDGPRERRNFFGRFIGIVAFFVVVRAATLQHWTTAKQQKPQ